MWMDEVYKPFMPPDGQIKRSKNAFENSNLESKALRFNQGKIQFNLIPWQWTFELGRIFTKGAEKYAPNNWKKSLNTPDHDQFVEDRLGSLQRHLCESMKGVLIDAETGCYHMALVGWNALCIFYYQLNDNRLSSKIPKEYR